MSTKISLKQSFPLLGGAVSSLFKNPQILYPFVILAFIQLFLMEILFFAPRFPLVTIFGPIVRRLAGEAYLHYPYNFELLNHWFQSAQAFIFLFISSFFVGKAIKTIAKINQGEELGSKMPSVDFRMYVNLLVAFLLAFAVMYGMTSSYGFVMRRALQIRSTQGIYFMIKQAVLVGAPYFSLLFSIIVTTVLAYVVPVVVLERKNVFIAIVKNFQLLAASFTPLLIVIFTSSLFYVPISLMRSNQRWFSTFMSPEGWQIFIIFGVLLMLLIDAVQYTAITMCYLLTRDE